MFEQSIKACFEQKREERRGRMKTGPTNKMD
jgi:hypothetical protein